VQSDEFSARGEPTDLTKEDVVAHAEPASAKQLRRPVVLVSISVVLIIFSFGATLIGRFLALQGGTDRSDLNVIQTALSVERAVFWVAALLLTALAFRSVRRLSREPRSSQRLPRAFSWFLLVCAAILLLLVVRNSLTASSPGADPSYRITVQFIIPAFLVTSVFVICVAMLRFRGSRFASPASTAALLLLLFVFFPLGLIGFVFRRSFREVPRDD